ncbi:LVIVD repeat-containing protein [Peribacillus sp. SCS-37]|uniref:LVIVD repeat-containing protein n=1 Tax=Paraperibacillus esterisolvens TaxID=3115296 RepID=UPI003905EC67
MKRNMVLSIALASTLSLSAVPFNVLAHDELGDVNIEKGERTNYDNVAAPVLEGSKNLKFLNEAAAPEMKVVRPDGKQNSFGDVYSYKGYAYVGTHTKNGGNGGVRVFDLKDPSNPEEVAVFANNDIPGTWQEKVIVQSVNTPNFKGDLAVVSVQQLNRNNPASKGGFLLYDVTNPNQPKKLGFWEVTKKTNGTHELYLTVQGNKAIVLAANPYADYYSHGEEKDFQIVDVSNPAAPKTLWQFDPRSLPEIPEDFNGYHWHTPDGKIRPVFNHSTMVDGKYAYVSMWDLGTAIFDISNPEKPVYLGRTDFASNQQGSAHSSAVAKGGTILIETREVYSPIKAGYEAAYGYTRIFDIKDKTNPKLLSEFKTDLTEAEAGAPATFARTVHDPKVQGNTLYLSHYAGGVRAVDITNPSNPVQIGSYVPKNSDIWGVFVDRNYILASDIGSGLKVLLKNNGNESPDQQN